MLNEELGKTNPENFENMQMSGIKECVSPVFDIVYMISGPG